MKIGKNGGRTTAAGADNDEGSTDHPSGEKREERKRERKRREKEEEARGGLSFVIVTPNRLSRLRRTVCSSATEVQVTHSEWSVSHATAVGVTKSCQTA
jgi:hypothetical protein